MLSLITFLIVLGALVIVHEFGHFIMARRIGVRVECFSLGFGPKVLGVKKGDTEYIISLVPLGGYVKLAGDDPTQQRSGARHEFLSRGVGERAAILAAGPMVNYALAFILFFFIYMAGNPTLTTEVGGLLSDYPAKSSGLLNGDTIISADGKPVKYWEELTEIIHKKTDGDIGLVVKRGDRIFDIAIRPKVKSQKDIFGNEIKIALIGIMPSEKIEKVKYGAPEASVRAFRKITQLTAVTYKAIWSIITRKLSIKDSMTGPLGIFVITGKAAHMGLIYILHFMAVLSTSLAIFNLIPMPVLDGGHMMFLALEKIMGRPLKPRTQEAITNFSVALLVMLTLYICYIDIVRFNLADKAIRLFRH